MSIAAQHKIEPKVQQHDPKIEPKVQPKVQEGQVRNAIKKVLQYITNLAASKNGTISSRCSSFIDSIETTPWCEAKNICAPYNILADSMRTMYIKNELPFLNDNECNNVKKYLDFITLYAGHEPSVQT